MVEISSLENLYTDLKHRCATIINSTYHEYTETGVTSRCQSDSEARLYMSLDAVRGWAALFVLMGVPPFVQDGEDSQWRSV